MQPTQDKRLERNDVQLQRKQRLRRGIGRARHLAVCVHQRDEGSRTAPGQNRFARTYFGATFHTHSGCECIYGKLKENTHTILVVLPAVRVPSVFFTPVDLFLFLSRCDELLIVDVRCFPEFWWFLFYFIVVALFFKCFIRNGSTWAFYTVFFTALYLIRFWRS